jgi:hypothetical protein
MPLPDHYVGVDRVAIQRLADHDARLAVLVPLTQESHRGFDREVAGHLSPDILELILLGPDVSSGAGNLILPVGKLGGPFNRRTADVAGVGKDAQVSALGESRRRQHREEK